MRATFREIENPFTTGRFYEMSKPKRNSVHDLVDTLKSHPLISENYLMWITYGYKRGVSIGENKKYADLLRRALNKGLIERVEVKRDGDNRTRFYYYVPRQEKKSK